MACFENIQCRYQVLEYFCSNGYFYFLHYNIYVISRKYKILLLLLHFKQSFVKAINIGLHNNNNKIQENNILTMLLKVLCFILHS